MNNELDLVSVLHIVAGRLDRLRIPYVVTGGIAVSYWGLPRTTHDIDIIIEINRSKINAILKAFERDFYISKEGVEGMLEHNISFSIIHNKSQIKIDFWPIDRKDKHKIIEFKRAPKENIHDKKISMIAPEDLILVKLQWFQDSGSSRHLEDIKSILKISKVDLKYIKMWAKKHSTIKILEEILKQIKK